MFELFDSNYKKMECYEYDQGNTKHMHMTEKSKIVSKCIETFLNNHCDNNKKKRNATKTFNDYNPLFSAMTSEDNNESPEESNDDVPIFAAITSKDDNEVPTESSPNEKDMISSPSFVSKITSSITKDEMINFIVSMKGIDPNDPDLCMEIIDIVMHYEKVVT